MNQKKIEIVKEKDILGLDKPSNQLKPLKRKNDKAFFIITFIFLITFLLVVYYFKK